MRPATEEDVPEEHRRKIIGSPSGDQTSLARQIRAKADFFRSIGIHINGISKRQVPSTFLNHSSLRRSVPSGNKTLPNPSGESLESGTNSRSRQGDPP